jgi:hypothetical protein
VYRSQRIGKESNNDTARIYPGCIATVGSGPGRVERRENAIAKQKRVCDICSVDVFPYGLGPPFRVVVTAPGKSIVV